MHQFCYLLVEMGVVWFSLQGIAGGENMHVKLAAVWVPVGWAAMRWAVQLQRRHASDQS